MKRLLLLLIVGLICLLVSGAIYSQAFPGGIPTGPYAGGPGSSGGDPGCVSTWTEECRWVSPYPAGCQQCRNILYYYCDGQLRWKIEGDWYNSCSY